jgi:hypothetical protein
VEAISGALGLGTYFFRLVFTSAGVSGCGVKKTQKNKGAHLDYNPRASSCVRKKENKKTWHLKGRGWQRLCGAYLYMCIIRVGATLYIQTGSVYPSL